MKNIEQYTCTFIQAKKLKELGVEQNSLFWWTWFDSDSYIVSKEHMTVNGHKAYPAFTSQELGELIDKQDGYSWSTHRVVYEKLIEISNHDDNKKVTSFKTKNEAQARAEFLIYLLESKHE